MKVIDVLSLHRELLIKLDDNGIRLEDARYVDLYSDYNRMLADGDKVSYIVVVLARKYQICERKVYQLLKRFGSTMSGA